MPTTYELYGYHKIYKVVPLDDYVLKIRFVDGTLKLYDMKPLIDGQPIVEGEPVPIYNGVPIFSALREDQKLFENVYVAVGRKMIIWNDMIDLTAYSLWTQGTTIDAAEWTNADENAANPTAIDIWIEEAHAKGIALNAWMYPRMEEDPHIQVEYEGDTACVALETGEILSGVLPTEISKLVHKYLKNRKERRMLLKTWHEYAKTDLAEISQEV